MFQSTRLKLTGWYLLIITCVCVLFTVAIYRGLTQELDRMQYLQNSRRRIIPERRLSLPPLDQEVVSEIKNRIQLILLGINAVIITISGGAAYFLAGRTLKPIKEMVDEQNRFVADASHELRTPLTALKTSTEVYLRGKKHTLEESNILLKSNLEEVHNLEVLSESLLRLAQFEKGKAESNFEVLSLADVVLAAVKKVSPMAHEKKITIQNDVVDAQLMGNEKSLSELFTILLDNAIKYSPEDTSITISSQQTDGHIKVTLADQGVGIAKEDMPHIFDRFYRTDASRTKKETSGYGLGLSIAKKIVAEHNGSIEVKSEVDKGTKFIVKLVTK